MLTAVQGVWAESKSSTIWPADGGDRSQMFVSAGVGGRKVASSNLCDG